MAKVAADFFDDGAFFGGDVVELEPTGDAADGVGNVFAGFEHAGDAFLDLGGPEDGEADVDGFQRQFENAA